jgi:hypothetical protein
MSFKRLANPFELAVCRERVAERKGVPAVLHVGVECSGNAIGRDVESVFPEMRRQVHEPASHYRRRDAQGSGV